MQQTVFTIGHSTHPQAALIGLLASHGITAVCDVRSQPYSRFNPQFNREPLEQAMEAAGIAYRFLGRELGARSEDPSCYRDGKVQYDRLAQTELFRQGLDRVRAGLRQGFRISLLCAEKEPLECHRTILVSRQLSYLGLEIQHIHADGRLESHAGAMLRLARLLDLPEHDLFRSPADLIEEAYRLQGDRIAYTREAAASSL